MSNDSAIRERIKEMAQLAILANRISEVQEKNLKHYPFVFFNEVNSVTIDYNVGRTIPKYAPGEKEPKWDTWVSYNLELDESANTTHLDKRFFCLEEAVRVLFWKDLTVRVFFNGKKVYESKNV